MTRIYLSGGWNDHQLVAHYARRLEAAGFELTYDWMKEAANPNANHDTEIPSDVRKKIAHDEIRAVVMAQVFWLLVPSYNGSKGSWIEFGAAITARHWGDVTLVSKIVVSGAWRGTIFTDHDGVDCYDVHEAAFKHIANRYR